MGARPPSISPLASSLPCAAGHRCRHSPPHPKQNEKTQDFEALTPILLARTLVTVRQTEYNEAETETILNKTKTQDFEALTPNLLARTVETVEGGGIIVLLLSDLKSLTQLYSVTMDFQTRLRTESHQVKKSCHWVAVGQGCTRGHAGHRLSR
jgi:hypothetical protein